MSEEPRKIIVPPLKILLIGLPHSGKSSFANTVDHVFTGSKYERSDTGREVEVGTTTYFALDIEKKSGEALLLETEQIDALYSLRIFDSPGIDMSSFKHIVGKQMAGVKQGITLKALDGNDIKELKENKIDVPIVIVSARDVLQRVGKKLVPVMPSYLVDLCDYLYTKLYVNPLVVVTQMDTIEKRAREVDKERIFKIYNKQDEIDKLIEGVKNKVEAVCHDSTISYISCWLPKRKGSFVDGEEVKEIITKACIRNRLCKQRIEIVSQNK